MLSGHGNRAGAAAGCPRFRAIPALPSWEGNAGRRQMDVAAHTDEGAANEAGLEAGGKAPAPLFNKDEDRHAYREMLLIRRFEEKAGQMYGMGLIGGFCHLYIGQEAVVVGMQMATKDGDQVITGYRDHGHMLVCGMDPKGVMAELTGRRGGYS